MSTKMAISQALSSGRPPVINMDSVDVEYPHDATTSISVEGAPYNGCLYIQHIGFILNLLKFPKL